MESFERRKTLDAVISDHMSASPRCYKRWEKICVFEVAPRSNIQRQTCHRIWLCLIFCLYLMSTEVPL